MKLQKRVELVEYYVRDDRKSVEKKENFNIDTKDEFKYEEIISFLIFFEFL